LLTRRNSEVSGHADRATGKAKEIAGRLTADEDLESEGKRQHAAGKTKEALDDVAAKAKGAVDAVKERLSQHK
jgi:uncharacterized protein YjbJ (UPF0337 family)